jgi:HSP20 family molecular chaperone IbpA
MNNNTTTDVFVVTDGLNTSFYTTALTSGASGFGSLTTSNTGYNYRVDTTPLLTGSAGGLIPTYNDFWKFDEEFDLLWKSFFDINAGYRPIREKAVNHPIDIQETDNGLSIEIAAVGLDKADIDIITDSETLRIAHRKQDADKEKNEYRYLHRSIKKASFDIAWKISSKYDLTKLEATLDKGLLLLQIPFAKENKPKKVEIK